MSDDTEPIPVYLYGEFSSNSDGKSANGLIDNCGYAVIATRLGVFNRAADRGPCWLQHSRTPPPARLSQY